MINGGVFLSKDILFVEYQIEKKLRRDVFIEEGILLEEKQFFLIEVKSLAKELREKLYDCPYFNTKPNLEHLILEGLSIKSFYSELDRLNIKYEKLTIDKLLEKQHQKIKYIEHFLNTYQLLSKQKK